MNDYEIGYEKGYQSAMYIDIGIWMLIAFLIMKFGIGKIYYKNNDEKLKTSIILAVIIAVGLLRAFILFV